MIDFPSILSPGRTRAAFAASSKKRALEQAAEIIVAEHTELDARRLFDQLMVRERLGSTGLGEGVALPHCRLDSSTTIIGAFLCLATPVDFDADDGQPVDLMFVLVVPNEAEGPHLEVLANVARVLGDPKCRDQLRTSTTHEDLHGRLLAMLDDQ